MTTHNLYLHFTGRFEKLGVPYMLTGSVAAMAYGEPRFTNDVDLVAHLDSADAPESIAREFPPDEFYCPPVETIREEMGRESRGHFNLIHHASGFKADVYLLGRDPLNRWGFDRRWQIKLDDASVWLAPREYVILRKLEFYKEGGSEKHLSDIRSILKVSAGEVDLATVSRIAAERGVEKEWKSILPA